jgi:DNA-binding response OmpR family regulator
MKKYRLLVVNSEETERSTLVGVFRLDDYLVDEAADGLAALHELSCREYQLMLVDLNLAGMSGIELLERAASEHPRVKAVILTAHGSYDTAVRALRLKASDYLEKPIHSKELLNCIRKILVEGEARLAGSRIAESQSFYPAATAEVAKPVKFRLSSGVLIDCVKRVVTWDEQQVNLTPIEARLLSELLEKEKQLLTHQDLAKAVYGYDISGLEAARILRTAISRLNKKLAKIPGGGHWIVNVRGSGYLLDVTPERIL